MSNSLILNFCFKLLYIFRCKLEGSVIVNLLIKVKNYILNSIFQSKIISSFLSYNQEFYKSSFILRLIESIQQLVIKILSMIINFTKGQFDKSFIFTRTSLLIKHTRKKRTNLMIFTLGLSLMLYSLLQMFFNDIDENLIAGFLISLVIIGLSIYDKDLYKSYVDSKSRKIIQKFLDYNY